MMQRLLRAYLVLLVLCVIYWLGCGGLCGLANYQVRQGHTQQALRLYRILGKIAPGYPGVCAYQGWREYELGNYTQAKILANRSLGRNPHDPEAASLLGQLAYREGDYEAALKYWEHDHLGRAWAFAAMKRYPEAREALEKCPPDTPGLDELRRELPP